MAYVSNIELSEAVRLLTAAKRVMITTHAKPDGDALGSVVALRGALEHIGVEVTAWVMPPVPTNLLVVDGSAAVRVYDDASFPAWAQEHSHALDLVVVLDTGAFGQVAPLRRFIEANLHRTLIVDHHLSGDIEAHFRYIDGKAAACCEIVADLVDDLSRTELGRGRLDTPEALFDATVREALFVGIASDTGWFRFSNTRPHTHEWAARLLRLGVDHAGLYQKLEQTERPEKLALLIRALTSMTLLADGRAAVMVLRASDFAETGALVEETERFVDVPQAVSSVEVVVLVTEPPPAPPPEHPGRRVEDKVQTAVRLSFRSKPGPEAVNVAHIAGHFGGGGHARASGAKVDGPLDQVVADVSRVIVQALGPRGGSR